MNINLDFGRYIIRRKVWQVETIVRRYFFSRFVILFMSSVEVKNFRNITYINTTILAISIKGRPQIQAKIAISLNLEVITVLFEYI